MVLITNRFIFFILLLFSFSASGRGPSIAPDETIDFSHLTEKNRNQQEMDCRYMQYLNSENSMVYFVDFSPTTGKGKTKNWLLEVCPNCNFEEIEKNNIFKTKEEQIEWLSLKDLSDPFFHYSENDINKLMINKKDQNRLDTVISASNEKVNSDLKNTILKKLYLRYGLTGQETAKFAKEKNRTRHSFKKRCIETIKKANIRQLVEMEKKSRKQISTNLSQKTTPNSKDIHITGTDRNKANLGIPTDSVQEPVSKKEERKSGSK